MGFVHGHCVFDHLGSHHQICGVNMGKGSKPRPYSVSQQQFADNFNAIFRKEEIEDDEDYICPSCSGSGEGMYDGAVCRKCKGTGGYPKSYYEGDYE